MIENIHPWSKASWSPKGHRIMAIKYLRARRSREQDRVKFWACTLGINREARR